MRRTRTLERRPVRGPVVMELRLCHGGWARGVVVNESLGGLGCAFAAGDARLLRVHRRCCTDSTVRMRFVDDPGGRDVAVRLAHVSAGAAGAHVAAGVSVNARDLRPSEVQYVFDVFEQLCV